jgi:two-component system sensor histidine kinase QseC
MTRSIKHRLMILVLGSITVVWLVAIALSYHRAKNEISYWQDTKLMQFAELFILLNDDDLRRLAQTDIDARFENTHLKVITPEDDGDKAPSNVLFQVTDANGSVIAASTKLNLSPNATLVQHARHGARTVEFAGHLWRAVMITESSGRTVRVFQAKNTGSDFTSGIAAKIAVPIAIALPALAILIWFSVGYSLLPLEKLSLTLRQRPANALDPVILDKAPTEVSPLVDAINQAMKRLIGVLERERAFTADAAHELKTPLAAIKVQAQVALNESNPQKRQLAMERIVQGVDRSAHLSEQLLVLARLDENRSCALETVDLHTIALSAITEKANVAERRNISLSMKAHATALISADAGLTSVLLRNLIDNSIKYGRDGGHVEVLIDRDDRQTIMTVRDDGPGVSDQDLPRLTDRFFRVTEHHASGSGLGLSIVARIVGYFNAQLQFGRGIGQQGLSVIVVFASAPARHVST